MEKLIVKFELNPTLDNANRIYRHEKKHPMSVCVLSIKQINILNKAMEMKA
tara:strand:+ start:525 stop:677 length:153 start_codon:yes stop_codon:yes gene_type:complete